MQHVGYGLRIFKYRWNVYRWYNNIEADNHGYAAMIMAWDKFLKGVEE